MLQHNRLLNHLNTLNFDHGFLRWLRTYLSQRNFSVRIDNNFGRRVVATSGVPQGSVLGPLLFASFMGSIDFESDLVQCVKYADDITLVESIETPSQQLLTSAYIKEKFVSAGLKLNMMKCNEMLIQRSVLPQNQVTTSVFSTRDKLCILGFMFSKSLSWDIQICDILKRAARRLYIIRCLKPIISQSELIIVYHSIVTSLILYASPAFGNLPVGLLLSLERFQNRAHKLICGRGCTCDKFPSLSSVLQTRGLSFLFKCESEVNHPLHHLVPKRLPRSNHFCMPFSSTNRRLNSFFPWFCARANFV